jgi:hypothetical protein
MRQAVHELIAQDNRAGEWLAAAQSRTAATITPMRAGDLDAAVLFRYGAADTAKQDPGS